MALTVNTNIPSLNTLTQLGRSQMSTNMALMRLSTGFRINSSKDDAAGLAIATRFSAQISGQTVARRNAGDAISLAQTAEGALNEITSNLQRIRELSLQSANVTNSASDRQALDAEVQQRMQEISRIARQTSFNGLKVLDGSLGEIKFQVGANVGQTISMDLSSGIRFDQIPTLATGSVQLNSDSFTGGTLNASQELTIAIGTGKVSTVKLEAGSTMAEVAAAIEGANIAGLNGVAINNQQTLSFTELTSDAAGADTATFTFKVGEGDAQTLEFADLAATAVSTEDFVQRVNAEITGLTASLDEAGNVLLTTDNGEPLALSQEFGDGTDAEVGFREVLVGDTAVAVTDDGEAFLLAAGQISLEASGTIRFGGSGLDAVFEGPLEDIEPTVALDNLSIRSVAGANDAVLRTDTFLDAVNRLRSQLGAVQNRFESVISNLDNSIENLSASRSRIMDTDFAAEAARLIRSQILEQVAVAILAQANARPQQILALLG